MNGKKHVRLASLLLAQNPLKNDTVIDNENFYEIHKFC